MNFGERNVCGRSAPLFSWEGFGTNSLSQNLSVLTAPSEREPLAWRYSFRLNRKVCGRVRSPGGAVAQRLRGFKSAEPEKTVKRSSRRTGVNLQFFPVEPTSWGLKGASSPFFVAPARRNRWHFSGSLLVSKENIPRQAETSLAETILNRPTQKAAAAPKVRRLLCLFMLGYQPFRKAGRGLPSLRHW